MTSDAQALVVKDHNDGQHAYLFTNPKQIDLIQQTLDKAAGEPLTAQELITGMDCGMHPECMRCWANIRRAWREWTKFNRSLGFDAVQQLSGMSLMTARYMRVAANVYQAKR